MMFYFYVILFYQNMKIDFVYFKLVDTLLNKQFFYHCHCHHYALCNYHIFLTSLLGLGLGWH